jgi:hypothetical protein
MACYRIQPPILSIVLSPSAEVLQHAECLPPVAHISPNKVAPENSYFVLATAPPVVHKYDENLV